MTAAPTPHQILTRQTLLITQSTPPCTLPDELDPIHGGRHRSRRGPPPDRQEQPRRRLMAVWSMGILCQGQ
jgi:hypothetical protein